MADIAQDAHLTANDEALSAASKLFVYLWNTAWEHAPGTVEGDADALHDMRVAVRRLRSALQNFEGPKTAPLLSTRLRCEFVAQRRKLAKLGDALGAVRDYDVLNEYLQNYGETQINREIDEVEGLSQFAQFLQTERVVYFSPMVKRIKKARKQGELREDFARWALGLPSAVYTFGSPATLRDIATSVLPRRIEEVQSFVPRLLDVGDAEGHHEMRKSLKRLRYSLEFFAPVSSQPLKSSLKTLTGLQDLLGEMNDRHVLRLTAERAFAAAKDNSKLPLEVTAFLNFGDERAQNLLAQVRTRWQKLENEQWLDSLVKKFSSAS